MEPKKLKPKVLFIYNSAPMPDSRLKTLSAWQKLASEVNVLYTLPKNYKASLIDKIFSKLKIPRDPGAINKRLLIACANFNPDIVFIVKGVTILPSTLKTIATSKAKLISWTNDDMYAWHNRSLWYTFGLKFYDLVVTQKSYNCNADELPSLGANVLFQNKAVEPEIHHPIQNCDLYNCGHDVVFIGAKEQARLEHLLYLAEHGIKVNIYGWVVKEKQPLHKNLIIHDRFLFEEEFSAAFSCSKISLNFLRKMNRDVQTSRSVEIPACKGFMLAERTNEHLQLFEEGKEAEFFSDNEELLKKVKYYLAHETERKAIAENGYQRCIKSDYSFENRMREVLRIVQNG